MEVSVLELKSKSNKKLIVPTPVEIYSRFSKHNKNYQYSQRIRINSSSLSGYYYCFQQSFVNVFDVVSHVHFHGLAYNGPSYALDLGAHSAGNRETGWHPSNRYAVFGECLEYVRFLKKKYAHVKWIWVLPAVENNVEWSVTIASLNVLVEKYPDIIDGFEFNLHFGPEHYNSLFANICNLNAEYCFNVPHIIFSHYHKTDMTEYKEQIKRANHIIIESFGYWRPWLKENKNPDSAILDWMHDYNFYSTFIHPSKITIGVDTCGVKITKDSMKICPLHKIVENEDRYITIRNNQNGFSILKFGDEYYTYDDEVIRKRKTNMVNSLGLEGMLMGDITDDIHVKFRFPLFDSLASLVQYQK